MVGAAGLWTTLIDPNQLENALLNLGMGTGLGLSMVYGFARQSGGQVRVCSEVGQGTTMCLYLPRHHGPENGVEAAAEPDAAPRAGQGRTVLVVDDEAVVCMLVAEVLEDLGFAAIEAATARRACACCSPTRAWTY